MRPNKIRGYFTEMIVKAISDHVNNRLVDNELDKCNYGFTTFELVDIRKRKTVKTAWNMDLTVYDVLVRHPESDDGYNHSALAINLYDDGQVNVYYNGGAYLFWTVGGYILHKHDIHFGELTKEMATEWLEEYCARTFRETDEKGGVCE